MSEKRKPVGMSKIYTWIDLFQAFTYGALTLWVFDAVARYMIEGSVPWK